MGGEGGAGQHDDWLRDRCDARRNSAGARAVQHAAVQTNRSKAGHVRLGSKPSSRLHSCHHHNARLRCALLAGNAPRLEKGRLHFASDCGGKGGGADGAACAAHEAGGGGEAGKQRLSGKQHVR